MMKQAFVLSLLISVIFTFEIAAQNTPVILSKSIQKVSSSGDEVVEINRSLFSSNELKKGTRFKVDVEFSKSGDLRIKRKASYIPGTTTYYAESEKNPEETFLFTYSNGTLNGHYNTEGNETYYLLKDRKNGQHYFSSNTVLFEEGLSCGVEDDNVNLVAHSGHFPAKQTKTKSISELATESTGALTLEAPNDTTVIDLMLVYTENAESWAANSQFGSIDVVLANAVANSQIALDNSGLPIELRVVHVHNNTTYTADDGNSNDEVDAGTHLRRFSQNDNNPVFDSEYNGYMQEIHALRDQYGADLVAAVMNEPETGGIAWRLGNTGGENRYGFSVNRVQQIGNPNNFTLVHELGHNMGNAHSRTQSSNAAEESGGLFHFSVGFQETNDRNATVMAYQQDNQGINYSRIPIFSSPDLSWNGFPLGTNSNRTPENSVLSMNIIKRTMSNYKKTQFDPPLANFSSSFINSSGSLSSNTIEVSIGQDETIPVTVEIGNTGDSPLMWEVDFERTELALKQKSNSPKIIANTLDQPEPIDSELSKQLVNHFPTDDAGRLKSNFEPVSILYETSFEDTESYTTSNSTYKGINDWRALGDNGFLISGDNPSQGNNHLRVGNVSSEISVYSPFLGYLPYGIYEAEFDFYYNESDSQIDLRFTDGKTGDYFSFITIFNGVFYYWEENASGGVSPYGTTIPVASETYHRYKVVYNLAADKLDHYLNGSLIYQSNRLNGNTPALFSARLLQNSSTAILDIDDLTISKNNEYNKWLEIDEENLAGFVRPGEQGQLEMLINAEGLDVGSYNATMLISTNEPDQEVYEYPIEVTVNQATSNEFADTDQPYNVELSQNYPNPFNPSTTIKYSLKEVDTVQLDVFNIQGQKVATLIDNETTPAGSYQVKFDASSFASGVYMYRLKTNNSVITRQMILIK